MVRAVWIFPALDGRKRGTNAKYQGLNNRINQVNLVSRRRGLGETLYRETRSKRANAKRCS